MRADSYHRTSRPIARPATSFDQQERATRALLDVQPLDELAAEIVDDHQPSGDGSDRIGSPRARRD